MSLDVMLLILRVAGGVLLLAFFGTVVTVLWRDYKVAARSVAEEKRQRGRLVVIAPQIAEIPLDDATIEIEEGDALLDSPTPVGASFPLLPVTSLGRAPTNTIVLNDSFCSQDHALITRRDGQWWLEDRASSNGTLLNGDRVVEPVVVSSGDVIGIGRVQLKIELE